MRDGNFCFMRKKENGMCNSLTISGTKLQRIIDEEVWEMCQELEIVILYMNKLSALPDQLQEFKDTITLVCIQNNCFRDISCLYDFLKLEHLNLHGNYLSSVPRELENFAKLTRLYLGDNDLVALPDIFCSFQNLKKASFKMNSLTRLPPSFSELHKLENLDISDNAMIKFPGPLLTLESLKFLNIERNRIQKIAPKAEEDSELFKSSFIFFQRLVHLQIKGNPICQHVRLKGTKNEVISNENILESIKRDKVFKELSDIDPTRSLRVNVLGDSGAGKTSVVQALTLSKYVIPTTQRDHRHTVGIDRYFLPVQIGGRTVLLHIWDHAGDDQYAMMNDLFISNESLVWVVVNLMKYCPGGKKEDPSLFMNSIGHWLLQVMSHNLKPIVWVICTHTDKCSSTRSKIDHMKYWMDCLCNCFDDSLSDAAKCQCNDQEKLKHIEGLREANVPAFLKKHMKIVELSNSYGFEGSEKIYEYLDSLLAESESALPNLAAPLYKTWQKAMDSLQQYAENYLCSHNLPAIPIAELEHIAQLPNSEEFREYEHNIGEM